jgi:antitoxin ChpS
MMPNATLRKLGYSVMVAIPPVLLDVAGFASIRKVGLEVRNGAIMIQPARRRRYALAELIALCDPEAPEESRDWIDTPPAGDELL